ncbi:hypothetical protein [Streptomyces canus]|uniref:hypothetical protein n=1 Tax=Streptomyces canus TaxID=58343 RepID=UPI002E2FB255|nr:hypothetical protein [Streptomyces canus]
MGPGPSVPLVVVAPGGGGAAPYRSVALGLRHYNSDFTVTDGRLTVDLRLQVRAVAGAATGGTLAARKTPLRPSSLSAPTSESAPRRTSRASRPAPR